MTKNFDEIDREELITILKSYLEPRYWRSNDFDSIIDNAVVNKEWGDVFFEFHQFNLYLNYSDCSYKDAEPKNGL